MLVQILGSAAGGGFPQWNCNCHNCRGLRAGTLKARPRTQSSIALSDDGVNWILCNASPDIRAQLEAFPPLQPARAVRDSPPRKATGAAISSGQGVAITRTARKRTASPLTSQAARAIATASGV